MILVGMVGLIALVCGRIRVTRRCCLVGKQARWYGLLVLAVAYPLHVVTVSFTQVLHISSTRGGDFLTPVVHTAVAVGSIMGIALVMRCLGGRSAIEGEVRPITFVESGLSALAIACLCALLFYFGITRGISTMDKVTKIDADYRIRGESFGDGKSVEVCIERFVTDAPTDAQLEEMIAVTSFNTGCATRANDKAAWCSRFDSPRDPKAMSSQIESYCKKISTPAFTCDLAVKNSLRVCLSSS